MAEPIEPDEVLAAPVGGGASLNWLGAPDDPADTSWIEDAGFEVTRQAPPVGSVTVGVPGVGFDLFVPDEAGRPVLAEAYGPDGQLTARSTLTGQQVPGALPQAAGSQGRAHDDTLPAPTGGQPHDCRNPRGPGGFALEFDMETGVTTCTICGRTPVDG